MMNSVRIAGDDKLRSLVASAAAGLAAVVLAGPMPFASPEPRAMSSCGLDDGEFMVDTSYSVGTAEGEQAYPAVAYCDSVFLVVWQDSRSGRGVSCARLTREGRLIDTAGIVAAAVTRTDARPDVASDGTSFLVVWTSWNGQWWEILGARVTPQGAVLDSSAFVVSRMTDNVPWSAVASGIDGYLVVWEGVRDSVEGIYAARVSSDGHVLDSLGIRVCAAVVDPPAVSFNGTDYLVVWSQVGSAEEGTYAARVSPDGHVLDSLGLQVSVYTPSDQVLGVGSDGRDWLVAWSDWRDSWLRIYAARVTSAGTVLDTAGIPLPMDEGLQVGAAVGYDGSNYLVCWQDLRDDGEIFGARMNSLGEALDSSFAISHQDREQSEPSLAFNGIDYLAAWMGRGSAIDDIFATRVTPDGTVPDSSDVLVSPGLSWQWAPAADYDGQNFLVVWQDHRVTWDIYGARIGMDGSLLDPQGIPVSTAPNEQGSVRLSSGGTNSLVVWTDGRNDNNLEVWGARVSSQGGVMDPGGIPIATAAGWQESEAVGSDGTDFLALWQDSHRDVCGARVTSGGVVLDSTGIRVLGRQRDPSGADVEYGGGVYLVASEEQSHHASDIYGTMVTAEGAVPDTVGFAISTAAGEQRTPRLSFDGTNFLVVWSDERGSSPDIYGARVTPGGVVLDPSGIPICTATYGQYCPTVSFDGTNHQVVWQAGSESVHLYGASVTPDGTVLDRGPVVVQEGNQVYPALAHGAGGQVFLAYQGWTGTVGNQNYNLQRIWGKLGPLGGIAEEPCGAPAGRLLSVAPNPLTSAASVMYTLPRPGNMSLRLYDVAGKLVRTLASGYRKTGVSSLKFRVSDFARGVYVLKLETEGHRVTEKLVIE